MLGVRCLVLFRTKKICVFDIFQINTKILKNSISYKCVSYIISAFFKISKRIIHKNSNIIFGIDFLKRVNESTFKINIISTSYKRCYSF